MVNAFYNPSGNPATGSQGLSALVRSEFAAISVAFDHMPQISTTGQFSTTFNQQGNFTFTLPPAAGTLAMLSDVATAVAAGAGGNAANAAAISANTAAIALLAPLASPAFTGLPTVPTPPSTDHTLTAVNSTWVANFLAASGYAPAGSSPVTSVATRTGAITLTHNDLTDWAATLAPYSTATATETTRAQAVEGQVLNNTGRNLFHNPMFRVQQRGAGPWTTTASYTADRWRMDFVNGTMNISLITLSDVTRAAIHDESAVSGISVSASGGGGAGDFAILSQFIEGVSSLSNKTVTVSFWAYSTSGAPNLGVGIRQSFGTGGGPSANVDMAGSLVTINSTPTHYSLVFAVPSTSGKTLGTTPNSSYTRIGFAFSSGATNASIFGNPGTQNATFVLWGMQCEIAPFASPVEKPDPQQDLAKCQRFFQTGTAQYYGYVVGTPLLAISRSLMVQMRTSPAIAYTGIIANNVNGATVAALDAETVNLSATGAASGAFAIQGTYTASADF